VVAVKVGPRHPKARVAEAHGGKPALAKALAGAIARADEDPAPSRDHDGARRPPRRGHGVRLIWVSNHGGRQLDQTQSTIDALPAIADAVGDRVDIVVDGGFARGTDVVKGLARGAKVVAVGRAALWGLAADGAAGVARALEILREEVRTTMGLAGRTRIADLTRDLIFRVD